MTDIPLEPDEPPSPLGHPLVVELEDKQHILDLAATDSDSATSLADRLTHLATRVLQGEGVKFGELSIALVDDPEMQQLNRQYLDHDYPTDTLSFLLDQADQGVIGQVIISTETAARAADLAHRSSLQADSSYSVVDEVALYVAHATLHLVGYDDHDPIDRGRMRAAEARYLAETGFRPPVSLEDSTLETLG